MHNTWTLIKKTRQADKRLDMEQNIHSFFIFKDFDAIFRNWSFIDSLLILKIGCFIWVNLV